MASGGDFEQKMSEETFNFVCNSCSKKDKIEEAVKYCVECSGYCCQPCVDVHKLFPTLEAHNLMDVSHGPQASDDDSSLLEFPTERCTIHKGKVMDMFCESHNVVGCYVCIAKDHKSCLESHIHSIPDMIDTIFNLSDCKQTRSLLKDMMVSMDTVSKSTYTKFQTLSTSKKEALDKVNTFEKSLEAVLRNRAELTRKSIENVYKQLEAELLDEQQTNNNIRDDMKKTDHKLNEADGNRAQHFACSKIAQALIEGAEGIKNKQQTHSTNAKITFIPDPSLMEYIKSVQGIGQVHFPGEQKNDLYKLKGCKDIPIRLSGDSKTSSSYGSCITHDDQLLVTDRDNKKLKRFDAQTMALIDYCTLDSAPHGVCCVGKDDVAVACVRGNKIQFVSTQNQMSISKQLSMSHVCYGIASKDDQLYVTDNTASLFVYNMTGTLLKTISNKLFGMSRHISFTNGGSNMFVGAGSINGVACFDGTGNYLSTTKGTALCFADGVCVDGRGNVFVVGCKSHNVVQISENGKTAGVVVAKTDGLYQPRSVCYHQGLNRMFVTMCNSDVMKLYELV